MSINIGESLVDALKTGDPMLSVTELSNYNTSMRDPAVGAQYVAWITEPTNLTTVQSLVVEFLKVPPRLMAIKRAPMSRTQRAVLFIRAIEMAIKRIYPETVSTAT